MSTPRERREVYATPRWRYTRHTALERDGHLCVRCARDGFTMPADIVHHVRPIRDGGDPWAMSNLESLCRSCHERTHRRKPPPHKAGPWAELLQELIKEVPCEEANQAAA